MPQLAPERGRTATPSGRSLPRRGREAVLIAGYLLLAAGLTTAQWGRSDRLFHQYSDQVLFEWMLARTARALVAGENPLHSDAVGFPDGVNLMANTSVLGLGVPLTPVTLLFGSQVAFLVAVAGCLAGTAAAWYFLLSRTLVRSRAAAAVGGLFCGFAPGMIAQAGAHLHMAAQFLVPVILWLVFDPRPGRTVRRGTALGLTVTYQVFLGEETLVFLVLACGLFALAYAVCDPATARRRAPELLGRLGVGTLTALPLLVYPLWWQFFGPQHYRGMPFDVDAYALDLLSFGSWATQTVAGGATSAAGLAPNATEENSFFGVPLLLLSVVAVIRLRRRPLVRALAACGLVFALLALGSSVGVGGTDTGLPGPYRLLREVPLLDLAVPARFPLIVVPVIAILLALLLDDVWQRDGRIAGRIPARGVWAVAVAAALLPLTPTPIRTVPFAPVPDFISSGQWRGYVPDGRTLVAVPPVGGGEATSGMLWSARTGVPFAAPGGFYIGPSGPGDPRARWGAPDRPTSVLLRHVARSGQVPVVTDADRAQAVADLRHWRAAVVVLGELRHGDAVRQTVELLLGPGTRADDVWIWDVRDRAA